MKLLIHLTPPPHRGADAGDGRPGEVMLADGDAPPGAMIGRPLEVMLQAQRLLTSLGGPGALLQPIADRHTADPAGEATPGADGFAGRRGLNAQLDDHGWRALQASWHSLLSNVSQGHARPN
jgi:hypothetical protein